MGTSRTNITLSIAANFDSNAFGPFQRLFSSPVNYGTGVAYVATGSVTSGTPDAIDVSGGPFLQPDGTAATFATVNIIAIRNNHATSTLTVGGGSNAVAGVSFKVPPKGVGLVIGAYAVVASTGDVLQVSADASTVSYDVMVVGA